MRCGRGVDLKADSFGKHLDLGAALGMWDLLSILDLGSNSRMYELALHDCFLRFAYQAERRLLLGYAL